MTPLATGIQALGRSKKNHQYAGGRHMVEASPVQWEIACKLADNMRPPMRPSELIRFLFGEALQREWEAAIAAGAITVEKP